MYDDFERAARKGLRIKPESLQLWSNFPGSHCSRLWPDLESLDGFPGGLLCRDRTGVVGCQVWSGWAKFRATKRHLTTRALSPLDRLQRLRLEILLVMAWGSTTWHMRKEVLRIAGIALTRMSNIILHLLRPEGEPCWDWHIRTCRSAIDQLASKWGDSPVVIIAASAVVGITALVTRPACCIVARTICWRSTADREALR